jgi:alkanesulfonate monooxygenase SsuD/methylene tetrahydromethanopterin reductase-like flavin-dependent oxidoreductase (luciferase family)
MRFGLWLTRHAEVKGWDGLWFADHLMSPSGQDSPPVAECWVTLAALAASIPRVRLGSLVSGNTYRHPAMLAKQAITTDHISGGRVVVGIGAGWQRNEQMAFGIPFPRRPERLARLEEACEILSRILHGADGRPENVDGRYYTLKGASVAPRPLQHHLPLLIGGSGEQITLRIVAKLADEWNILASPSIYHHKSSVLERHCEAAGRDPGHFIRSVNTLLTAQPAVECDSYSPNTATMSILEAPRTLDAYAKAGVAELIICDPGTGSTYERRSLWDRFITAAASVA